ncbi:MAG: zinc ribbon domain-containing protein [Eubacteriaceae bacterium]|nr:zinc ribbon domain-containing protein [Eubacteriaceae bacterium]
MSKNICPNCGAENDEHAVFCRHCGASLDPDKQIEYPQFQNSPHIPEYGSEEQEEAKDTTPSLKARIQENNLPAGTLYRSDYEKRSGFRSKAPVLMAVLAVFALVICIIIIATGASKSLKDIFGKKEDPVVPPIEPPVIDDPGEITESRTVADEFLSFFFTGETDAAAEMSEDLPETFWAFYGKADGEDEDFEEFDSFDGYCRYIESDYRGMKLQDASNVQLFYVGSASMEAQLINEGLPEDCGFEVEDAAIEQYQCAFKVDGSIVSYYISIYCYKIGGVWYPLW